MGPALVITLFALLVQQPQTQKQGGEDPFQAASEHLEAGRAADAAKLLEGIVLREPKMVAAHFNLAIAYTMLGRDADAISGYRKALELSPELVEAQLNLGQLLVKTGESKEAAPLLRKALAARPADVRGAYMLARALSAEKPSGEACEWFAKASLLAPSDEGMKLETADCYERAGLKEQAIAAYRELVSDPAAAERLAILLMEQGATQEAARWFEDIMKRSPSAAAAYALATCYLRLKDLPKAIQSAVFVVEREPGRADVRLFLGRLYRDAREFPKAAEQFVAAAKIDPKSIETWNELSGVMMLTKNFEAALMALDRSKELGGETAAYWWFRAAALDALDRPQPALDSYKRFLATSEGKFPDEEFKARQRARILEREVRR